MHVCDVSSKDVFNWSSVKVNQNLYPEFDILKFPKFPQKVKPLLFFFDQDVDV